MKSIQLFIILITLLLPCLANPSVLPRRGPLKGELCTVHEDGKTCTLFYRTNSGQVADLSDPQSFIVWGHATIYSPGCTPWGSTTNALAGNVKIQAWGLDFNNPLVLNVENGKEHKMDFSVPVWTYGGRTWHGTTYCFCLPGWGKGEHTCECPWECQSSRIIG